MQIFDKVITVGSPDFAKNIQKFFEKPERKDEAKKLEDLNQYSYNKYAMSFDIIPRILAENAGLDINVVLPDLNTKNQSEPHGIDVEKGETR